MRKERFVGKTGIAAEWAIIHRKNMELRVSYGPLGRGRVPDAIEKGNRETSENMPSVPISRGQSLHSLRLPVH
jgi:hypothetical protein